jgi:hypothetical protein
MASELSVGLVSLNMLSDAESSGHHALRRFLIVAAASMLLFVGLFFSGLALQQQKWGTPDSSNTQPFEGPILRNGINVTAHDFGYDGVLSGGNFLGILFCAAALLLGPSTSSMAIVAAGKLLNRTHRVCALLAIAAFSAAMVVFAWCELITGGQPCYFDKSQPVGYNRGQINGCAGNWLNVVWGAIINVLYLPLCLLALSMLSNLDVSAPPRLPFHSSAVNPLPAFSCGMLFFLTTAFAAGCFTYVVNYGDSYKKASLHNPSYREGQFGFDSNGYALNQWCWSADGCLNDFGYYYKLYPDVVIYYAFIFSLLLAGLLIRFSPPLHRFMHHRVRLHALPPKGSSSFHPMQCLPHGCTVGELFLCTWALALFAMWVNFWTNGYCQADCLGTVVNGVVQTKFQCCRFYYETTHCNAQLMTDPSYGCGTAKMRRRAADFGVDPSISCTGSSQCASGRGFLQYPHPEYDTEAAARVVGHIANLAFSLMLYPVSKHSPWLTVFGVGFPHALKFHRVMGNIGFFFATLHMFIWYGQWAVQGTLWDNVGTIDFLRISPVLVHWDNW